MGLTVFRHEEPAGDLSRHAGLRRQWFDGAIELLIVVALAGTVLFFTCWPPFVALLPMQQTYLLLALATSAASATAGLVAEFTIRMQRPSRVSGFPTALACYALTVMPLSVMHGRDGHAGLHAAGLVANFAFLIMLLLGLRPLRSRWLSGWRLLAIAVAATALTGLLADRVPLLHAAFLGGPALPQRLVVLGWGVTAVMFAVRGALARQSLFWRVGLGVAVVAVAHLVWFGSPSNALPFTTLRALGILVLLAALGSYAREVNRAVTRRREEEERRLRALQAATAERDHEMRNVLTGLSGAAYLLTSGGDEVPRELAGAVRGELERLRELVESAPRASGGDSTSLAELLARIVMLRRAAGSDVELTVESGLDVAMPAAPLAQVVTNLLVNCARHAPGAPVRVSASGEDGRVVIEVADAGPGLRGRTPARDGGFGLPVSRRLLAEHGGSLRLTDGTDGYGGCRAVIDLPAKSTADLVGAEIA